MSEEELKQALAEECESIEFFAEIDSTNTYLLNAARQANGIRVAIADSQTRGRGQHQRVWHSPKGENIYLSVLFPFSDAPAKLQGLTLAVGVSLIKTLEAFGIQGLKLKWPNDLFYQGKKLGGILVEVTNIAESSCSVVVGIGLNVNMQKQDSIDQAWTSLKLITGKEWARSELILTLLKNLFSDFSLFTKEGYSAFHQAFLKYEL